MVSNIETGSGCPTIKKRREEGEMQVLIVELFSKKSSTLIILAFRKIKGFDILQLHSSLLKSSWDFHFTANGATRMNLREFSDQQRYRMCVEAFQEIHRTEGRKFRFLENMSPGENSHYSVHVKPGKRPKKVLAFKCPIHPLVYLSVADQESRERIVWVIVPETESKSSRLNIVGYDLKIVDDISESEPDFPFERERK